jgi:cytochrome c-type biogenesis protein CcmE
VVAASGFVADTVLAKHDERYMPAEVVEALKKQGVWQDSTGTATLPVKPETAAAR